jgi:hypothetical protein
MFISGAPVEVDNPDTVVLQKPFDERQLARALACVVAAAGQAVPKVSGTAEAEP